MTSQYYITKTTIIISSKFNNHAQHLPPSSSLRFSYIPKWSGGLRDSVKQHRVDLESLIFPEKNLVFLLLTFQLRVLLRDRRGGPGGFKSKRNLDSFSWTLCRVYISDLFLESALPSQVFRWWRGSTGQKWHAWSHSCIRMFWTLRS